MKTDMSFDEMKKIALDYRGSIWYDQARSAARRRLHARQYLIPKSQRSRT